MRYVVVMCPTRGRPERAAEMVASFRATASLFSTELVLVVDDDDGSLPAYREIPARFMAPGPGPLAPSDPVRVMVLPRALSRHLTAATNLAARRLWADDCVIGHVGDDHLFRTPGWDRRILEVLERPGVAYGDDLFQGPRLPTAAFLSSIIPRALGWYALPGTRHLRIDTAWKVLGERIDSLHYLPDVVIEHVHPGAGKADRDAGYDLAIARRSGDRAAFVRWLAGPVRRDVQLVRHAIAAAR